MNHSPTSGRRSPGLARPLPTPARAAGTDATPTPGHFSPRPHRQRRKAIRPQQLLDAALELFVEKGFTATRSDEVAARAGVSKGTLYLYYPSKEELFKAVVRQNMSNLIAEGVGLVASFEGSTSELLATLLRQWWERTGHCNAGGLHKMVISEVRNFPELAQFYVDEVITPAKHLFRGTVQRGIDRGEFRSVPTQAVAQALMAPVLFLMLHQHSFGACPLQGPEPVDPLRVLEAHVDLMLHGLERPPEPAAPTARSRRSR